MQRRNVSLTATSIVDSSIKLVPATQTGGTATVVVRLVFNAPADTIAGWLDVVAGNTTGAKVPIPVVIGGREVPGTVRALSPNELEGEEETGASGSGTPLAAVVGGVAGGVVLLVLLVVWRTKRRQRVRLTPSGPEAFESFLVLNPLSTRVAGQRLRTNDHKDTNV